MRALTPLVLLLPLAACEPPPLACTDEARPGIVIHLDDELGDPVCDAELVLTAGERVETLTEGFETGGACVYSGATEAAGEYTVDITARGYLAESLDISVGEDECHVITEEREVTLTIDCPEEPNPGLDVIVRDQSAQPLCNVSVRAFQGPADNPTFEEDLERIQLGPGNCRYVGLFDTTGTFALAVDANEPFEDLVTAEVYEVSEDICGTVRTEVGVILDQPPPCPPFIAPMFQVSVTDADTSAPVCDATVTATEDDVTINLLPNNCVYQELGNNRAGTYTLDIAREGYVTLSIPSVSVPLDEAGCTVVTHTESYALTPSP
jgi:hypothetical protein